MSGEHSGHRERLKNRFIKDGNFSRFETHNILEMLLFYSIPRRDTNEIAHELLKKFGSLSAIFDAPYEDLINYGKLSPNTACLIKSIIPISRAYNEDKYSGRIVLHTVEEITKYITARYNGEMNERFSVISLDNIGTVLSFDFLSEGGQTAVAVDQKDFVRLLLRTKASNCIIVHNHPGNLAIPSNDDATLTRNLVNAANTIDVRVLDHIVVAGQECFSMRSSKDYKIIFE